MGKSLRKAVKELDAVLTDMDHQLSRYIEKYGKTDKAKQTEKHFNRIMDLYIFCQKIIPLEEKLDLAIKITGGEVEKELIQAEADALQDLLTTAKNIFEQLNQYDDQ